ncbi:MAG TPA: ABC transporter permease [Steroidobacteraceae bacterium]|nr:ABC transporter permease [Steroidobacteraceae bacterium]
MQFIQDLRVAFRSLLRAPAFTGLATGVLGLGLAVVVTMFGILYTIAYEPPPFPRPESLVGVHIIDKARGKSDDGTSTHQLADWRAAQSSFEELGGGLIGTVIISGDGAAERYDGGLITGTLFNVIDIAPLIGRTVQPSDDIAGAAPVVVLSYHLWRTRYHGDRDIIGRVIKVNGELASVIGVMPQVFDFPNSAQLWIPLREKLDQIPRGKGSWVQVIGRLRPGVSIDDAQADLSAISARLAERYPETNAGLEPDVLPIAAAVIGRDDLKLFQTLFASVFLVLIIASVNVAGLMLVRATTRTQEASVRRALGAGRTRLVMQMLAESFVIGSAAALLGLTLGAACLEVLSRILTSTLENLPSWWDFAVDGRVALFAVAVGVLSTVAAGLFPALRVAGIDINGVLRDGTRDTGLSTGRIIRWLVVVEIALSCVLLTSAGIMVRIAIQASTSDLGVDVRPFMTGRIGLPEPVYPDAARQARFIEQLQARAQAIPGASAATLVTAPPAHGVGRSLYALPDHSYVSQADYPYANEVATTPGFFEAMGGRVIAGRDFSATDRQGSLPVVLVSETFARTVWPGQSAIGQRLRLKPNFPDSEWLTVVGVVGDIMHDDEPFGAKVVTPTLYVPLLQRPERFFTLVLRTAGDPHVLAPAIRDVVTQLDPDLAVYWLRTIPEARAINSGGLRIIGGLFVVFGVVTIVLAASGIYGVLAHSVAQSTREIAIRRALGAPDGGIVGAVARRSGWQLGLGLAIGIGLAPLMAVLLGQAIGGANLHDPWVYATVLMTLTLAIAAATAVPLRRALLLQPGVALRHT